MKQKDNNEAAPDEVIVPVTKIHEPETSLIDSDTLPEIDEILNDPRLQGATTGISIRNASTGEIIYSNLGDTRVHPASVMKLLTGAAALETLGEDYTFKTELFMDGRIENGVLHGNLYLRGRGDPTLTKNDLQAFASELKAKGINSVAGNVYGDDTWYDNIRLSQDLNWSDELYYTGSQVSALTLSPNNDYDAGTVIVEVTPATKSGQAGKVEMVPANTYMTIVNKTQTVSNKGKKSIALNASMARIQLSFLGRYRQAQKKHVHGSPFGSRRTTRQVYLRRPLNNKALYFLQHRKLEAKKSLKEPL